MGEENVGARTGRSILRTWFDSLEDRLAEDARRAGLFDQPTLVGQAREFVVREALGSVLPKSLQVGTGRILRAHGPSSAQIDIVVFDRRFPCLQMQDNTCLFPVEGVLAAIEVKSRLDAPSLHQALDNCMTVMQLIGDSNCAKEDYDAIVHQLVLRGCSEVQAHEEVFWQFLAPRTYVFSFSGFATLEAFNDALDEWLELRGVHSTATRPLLPSVIVAGSVIGALWGDPVRLTKGLSMDLTGNQIPEHLVNRDAFMVLANAKRQFGLFLTHLLWHIDQRHLGGIEGSSLRASIAPYLPFDEYFAEEIQDPSRRIKVLQRPPITADSKGFIVRHTRLRRTPSFETGN